MMNTGSMMNDPNMAGQAPQPGGMPAPQEGAPPPPQGMPQQPPVPQQGMEAGTQEGSDQDSQEDQIEKYVNAALMTNNIAKKLRDEKDETGTNILEKMGAEIVRGFDEDVESRQGWMEANKRWIDLALLVRTGKSFPWPKASDIKYPLLATAAMQFSARAYPALIPSDGDIVKMQVTRTNATPDIYDAAQRVAAHMSFQIRERIPNWEEDMDKLLMTIPITGLCFKKTYYSKIDGVNHSHIVYPEHLVVNYHAKSIEKAYRKSEILFYTENDIKEKVNNDEEFLDVELPDPTNEEQPKRPILANEPGRPDKATTHQFIQCHTYWDLDDDGYEEPYVITVHYRSKKVVRVIARFEVDGIKRNKDGQIVKIQPYEYYTAYPFIPNPDGSIYALGFGILLGPMNESVNTLINQLVDAGTINNLQSGFIAKGLRMKMGDTALRPGEWRVVNATGDDLNKSVFPLPSKAPSEVLYQLLQMLVTAGNQLASIAEIFVGKMPGQNTPATTTQETIQQGMAVFTAIYKRVYRSMTSEFKKLFKLNKLNSEIIEEESNLSGIQLQESDYELPDWMVVPGADPIGDSSTVRMAKLQQVGSLISLGTINVQAYTAEVLRANEIPNAQALQQQPPPPQPDPKVQTEQAKQQTIQMKGQTDQAKAHLDMVAKQQDTEGKAQLAQVNVAIKALELRHEQQMSALNLSHNKLQNHMDMVLGAIQNLHQFQKGQLELAQSSAKHDLKMDQMAEQQAASNAGKT